MRSDAGSFRDPASRVYLAGDRVLRALSPEADEDLAAAEASSAFRRAVEEGRLVPTRRLDASPVELGIPATWSAVVEHPRLDLWTYPYEWSFSMLQDAALLQLGLLRDALEEDLTLKDASPYNVQFDGARPVFIDVGSFERLVPGDPWYGYLQFCQLFLYPLLLQAHGDLAFQPFLRASVDGITPEVAARVLGPLRTVRRGVLVHVALHARAQRRFSDTSTDVKDAMRQGGFSKQLIQANVAGLLRLVEGLRWEPEGSTWSGYGDRSHYTERELAAKEAFVRDVVGARRRSLVWDVGCNDGRFSRIASDGAERVLAMDNDALVVDLLYRRLREHGVANVVPLVVDLADPAPGLGWRSRERTAFLDRNRPDLVLLLAVVHHLAITSNVPTSEVLDLLVDLGSEVVIEFPTERDPMVERLVRNKREGVHAGYSLERFDHEVAERFTVRRREELASGTRVLFHLAPG